LTSDYAPLTVNISIFEKNIQTSKQILAKNRKEEEKFMNELFKAIKRLNMENIQNIEVFEYVIQSFTNNTQKSLI